MRGRNIIQLIKAVDLLSQPGGTTIRHMSDALNIDRRNVYRLLKVIEELGFPLYDDNQNAGREKAWKLDADYVLKLPNLNLPDVRPDGRLNLSEIISLYLLKAESGLYAGTEIETRINTAFSKLSQYVPKGFHEHIKKLQSLFVSSKRLSKDYSGKEAIIDELAQAMVANNTCRVSYFSFRHDEIKTFSINPLHFFESNGGLYLFVCLPGLEHIRILAIERIETLKVLDDIFAYPADFDPEERLSTAFSMIYDDPIELEVVFSADQAKYIRERKFAPDQKISESENQDGSITLKLSTSGWTDVKRWLMGFGASARVVKPERLRDEIIREIQGTLALYNKAELP